jgi:mRNA interferase RelE/StbE
MYSIYLTDQSSKFLEKLPAKDAENILKKIYSIRENPFMHVKRLRGMKLWRLRINDYRAVLDLVVFGRKMTVVRIGHRRDVYEKI